MEQRGAETKAQRGRNESQQKGKECSRVKGKQKRAVKFEKGLTATGTNGSGAEKKGRKRRVSSRGRQQKGRNIVGRGSKTAHWNEVSDEEGWPSANGAARSAGDGRRPTGGNLAWYYPLDPRARAN